ncbi:MAG: thymidine phosphorylase [Candidatus Pacebacteria bacterium]|nr:thymidine phosphorylase [Candidatus Paceibacterota bacterium]MDD5621526.1 thymidine phosphorylase [Candidatus Paceibacterota bacterium]
MKNGNFFLKIKFVDISARVATGVVLINQKDCEKYGIKPGSNLAMHIKSQTITVHVDITDTLIKEGEVGIFKDLGTRYQIKKGETIEFSLTGIGKPKSLEAIQKNMLGHDLSYEEMKSIVSDIVSRKLNDVLIAFFVSSSFLGQFTPKELFYLTKAMVETGKRISFPGIVVDKHSIGGLCGNETTPVIVPIVASFGVYMPKTCSRAVTSASGTADTFEVLAPVSFTDEELKKIVMKTKGCIIWGTGDITPSDAIILDVASQLLIESFPKMVASIIAKKVALGVKYLVIDIPVNKSAKIKNIADGKKLEKVFLDVTRQFGIKTIVSLNTVTGPIGRGIGAALQIRDDLKVLEQQPDRPMDLEKRAVELSGIILEMSGAVDKGKGRKAALETLTSGRALMKMKAIIAAQGGNPEITSKDIKLGKKRYEVKSNISGTIKAIDSINLSEISRILGSPFIKSAGIYFEKKMGDKVNKGDILCSFYSTTDFRIELALKTLKEKPIFEFN